MRSLLGSLVSLGCVVGMVVLAQKTPADSASRSVGIVALALGAWFSALWPSQSPPT